MSSKAMTDTCESTRSCDNNQTTFTTMYSVIVSDTQSTAQLSRLDHVTVTVCSVEKHAAPVHLRTAEL